MKPEKVKAEAARCVIARRIERRSCSHREYAYASY